MALAIALLILAVGVLFLFVFTLIGNVVDLQNRVQDLEDEQIGTGSYSIRKAR